MNSGIYTITNLESSKVYIGSTIDFERRWYGHRWELCRGTHGNFHLQRSWNKYGEDAFEFGILEYLDNLDELVKAEQFWMDVYREEGKELYNIAIPGKAPMLGRSPSEDHRRNLSISNKGQKCSKETRRRLSEALTGRVLSEEHKRNIGKAGKGRVGPMLGKHHTKEALKKIANAGAKTYPAFIHRVTGELIPAGVNLSALCRKYNFISSNMYLVAAGKQSHHKGWELRVQMKDPDWPL